MTAALPLVDAARMAGGYAWLEERLFEILGAWVPEVPEPEVKLRLAADSLHHGWHASLWRERLPALQGMDSDQFVTPGGRQWEQTILAVRTAATTVEKLTGIYRVWLPRQVVAYQQHLDQATLVTDGPAIRVLQLVMADELADWRDGERLLEQLLVSADDVRRAAAHQAQLETLLVGGGGGRESNPPDGDHPSQPL